MSGTFLAVVMLKKWTPLWRETHLEVKMFTKHFMLGSTLLKKFTLLWHEAYFEIKIFKASHVRSTFELEMLKKCTPLWRKAHFEVKKCTKHSAFRALLEDEMFKKLTLLWREAHSEVKMHKTPHVRATFVRWSVVLCGRRKGFCTLPRVSKTWGFCVAFPKAMTGVGHSKRICKDGFRVAGTVQETFSSEMLRGQAADFLRGVAFWSIRFSDLRRWFCVTGAGFCITWPHFFRGRRNTLDTWTGKIAKHIGTRPSALHSTFHSCLSELLCFCCCQLRKSEKPRRIVSSLTLSSSKIEDVSQNCFVFDVTVSLKNWRSLAE